MEALKVSGRAAVRAVVPETAVVHDAAVDLLLERVVADPGGVVGARPASRRSC